MPIPPLRPTLDSPVSSPYCSEAVRRRGHDPGRDDTTNPYPLLDHGRMLEMLGIEGQLLVAATHDAHPDVPVAGVSGRTLGQTIRHAGDLCEDTLAWMGTSASTAPDNALPPDASKHELTRRFTARLADLLAEFGTRPPGDPCPTWWPEDHSVTFWIRRMLHATTMHRVDVQTAAGVPATPVETDLACDGIDEILRLWFGHRLRALGVTAPRAWSVMVTAENRSWTVDAGPESTAVVRETPGRDGGQDGVITGAAPSVYLWLWGRLPDRTIEVAGDRDAIAQLWSLLRLATQ